MYREKKNHNKVDSIVRINIVEDVEIAELISKNVYNIFSRSRSGIKLIQSKFKLIKFGDSKRKQTRKLIRYEDVIAGMANILVV